MITHNDLHQPIKSRCQHCKASQCKSSTYLEINSSDEVRFVAGQITASVGDVAGC